MRFAEARRRSLSPDRGVLGKEGLHSSVCSALSQAHSLLPRRPEPTGAAGQRGEERITLGKEVCFEAKVLWRISYT
jgi:hypothetical protein